MRVVIGAVALLITNGLIAGCGNGSNAGVKFDDLNALGSAIGCTSNTEDDTGPAMFAAQTNECELGGDKHAELEWFNNNGARDNYMDVGTSNGAVYVYGDHWAAECYTKDVQALVKSKTKGDTRDE